MDQLKYQNIAALTQSIKAHHNLVKLTQLLVSVSVCSFIFSPSSLLIFLHYFKFYLSTFPFQLFTHNIDKNSMFLLCNGLLVFVGITKSFSWSGGNDEPSKYIEDDEPSKYIEDDSPSQFLDVEANKPMLEKTSELDEQNIESEEAIEINKYCTEEVEEKIEETALVDEEQEKGSSQSVLEEEEKEPNEENGPLDAGDEEEESEIDYSLIEENIEDEDEEEEENCVLSTEELNKKFDDFIRRMKEDIRIEAKRQLVMV